MNDEIKYYFEQKLQQIFLSMNVVTTYLNGKTTGRNDRGRRAETSLGSLAFPSIISEENDSHSDQVDKRDRMRS